MKVLKKIILAVFAFVILYAAIMLGAYHYFFKYPRGYLDEVERAAEKRNYKIALEETLDDGDTLLYFSRSGNGAGDQLHVGTIYSKYPAIIANFFCEETSSVYFPINTYGYTSTLDGKYCYLFGATTDENTVKVEITFEVSGSEKKVYEAAVNEQIFYILGFDYYYAQFPSSILGLNSEDGITFSYDAPAISDGSYVER